MNADVFTYEYAQRSEQLFLRPCIQYRWDKIVNGVYVRREDGSTKQMWAVDPSTFRSFYLIDEKLPGAKATFQQYFTDQRPRLINELRTVSDRYRLHQLSNDIRTEILRWLTNIEWESSQLDSYNKVRKPVDLYLEHLVAMSLELEEQRPKLVPLLYLPLDSWMFKCPYLFTKQELKEHDLSRSSTFAAVKDEDKYRALQRIVDRRAGEVSEQVGPKFYPIYFDILWGNRYRNLGSNLFETNPLKNPRCG